MFSGNLCFFYDEYGGVYHCWLQMDSALIFGQYIPIITLVILTFAIVEAAGSSDNYERLDDVSFICNFKMLPGPAAILTLNTNLNYILVQLPSLLLIILGPLSQNIGFYGHI